MLNQTNFNIKIYADDIKSFIPDIEEHDLCFIANKAAKLYKKIEPHGCVDNFRVSKISSDGSYSDKYKQAIANGCCGFADRRFKNELTGNKFIIGFNFGH